MKPSKLSTDTLHRIAEVKALVLKIMFIADDAAEQQDDTIVKYELYRVALVATHLAEIASPEAHAPETAMSTLKAAFNQNQAGWQDITQS